MTKRASRTFDFSIRDELLKDPEEHAALYLEECLIDGDMELFQAALKDVAKAQGGMQALAKDTELNRESLYRALSKKRQTTNGYHD